MLEETKDSNINLDINYSTMLAKEANRLNDEDKKAMTSDGALSWRAKAENYAEAYANLYDEIVQGYANGTRKVNVEDKDSELGYRTLTMEEELGALDKAYEANVKFFEETAIQEQKARRIIEEEAEKMAHISNGRTSRRMDTYLIIPSTRNGLILNNSQTDLTLCYTLWIYDLYSAAMEGIHFFAIRGCYLY